MPLPLDGHSLFGAETISVGVALSCVQNKSASGQIGTKWQGYIRNFGS